MDQRLSIVTLGVADVGRSRGFYERLGWTAASSSQEAIVFFQLGGMALALYGRDALAEDARIPAGPSGFGAITLAYNARTREDVDAVLAEAAKAGATILKAAEDVFWGGYSGYFADPDGHPWEVCWNPYFKLEADGRLTLAKA